MTTEQASSGVGVGRSRSFPAEWGEPVGSPFSEERKAWILSNVRRSNPAASSNSRAALQLVRAHMALWLDDHRRLEAKRRR